METETRRFMRATGIGEIMGNEKNTYLFTNVDGYGRLCYITFPKEHHFAVWTYNSETNTDEYMTVKNEDEAAIISAYIQCILDQESSEHKRVFVLHKSHGNMVMNLVNLLPTPFILVDKEDKIIISLKHSENPLRMHYRKVVPLGFIRRQDTQEDWPLYGNTRYGQIKGDLPDLCENTLYIVRQSVAFQLKRKDFVYPIHSVRIEIEGYIEVAYRGIAKYT